MRFCPAPSTGCLLRTLQIVLAHIKGVRRASVSPPGQASRPSRSQTLAWCCSHFRIIPASPIFAPSCFAYAPPAGCLIPTNQKVNSGSSCGTDGMNRSNPLSRFVCGSPSRLPFHPEFISVLARTLARNLVPSGWSAAPPNSQCL